MKRKIPTIVKKIALLSLAVAGIAGTTQAFGDEYIPVPVPVATASVYQPRTLDDLQTLTAPIALYPDALLAQVLAASTYPNDVIAAEQYMQNGGDPNQTLNYGWDASVAGLLQTPQVLNQLAGNVPWMNQLGDAFLNQQGDVDAAIQALRAKAQGCGNLVSTAQEQVVVTGEAIEILPANPQVIYVPVYDPAIVYVTRPVNIYDPCITFGDGIRIGVWLHDDFDWHDRRVYSGNWGGDRPWWRADRGGVDYVNNRPGVYVSNQTHVTNVTNIRNTNVVNTTTVWSHDDHRPAPIHAQGPVVNRVTNVVNNRTNVTIRQSEIPTRTQGKTETVNHNLPVRTPAPNPVHQPAAREIPAHGPQSVSTTTERTTSRKVTRNLPAQDSRNTQQTNSRATSASAHTSSNTTVSRGNENPRSNVRHG